MEKYNQWIANFEARDTLTAVVFVFAAIVLLVRARLPKRLKNILDPILGGLYCVGFCLVLAFYHPTL